MTVKVDVPDYSSLVDNAMDRVVIKAIASVEANAKITAPVDTGFYRSNIKPNFQDQTITAEAEYSAAIEYGVSGTRREPTANMRMAARKTQKEVNNIFKGEFK